MMEPPRYLTGEALSHFMANAEYMDEVKDLGLYGESDATALAKMSVSYQKSLEYLKAEQDSKNHADRERSQRMRLAEDKNYQQFMRMLKLDPDSKAKARRRVDRLKRI